MQIIKNILNDLNKSYELILNVSLFSSIIIILQSFIFYEVDLFNISVNKESKTVVIILLCLPFILFLKQMKKSLFTAKLKNIKVKSKLNIVFFLISITLLSFSLSFTLINSLSLNIIFFMTVISISSTLVFISDKFDNIKEFMFLYEKLNIPDTYFEVSYFNVSFMHNNLSFKYNKIDDGLEVENQKLGYLELKIYLEKNNITLNDFDINHLNLIKIMSY